MILFTNTGMEGFPDEKEIIHLPLKSYHVVPFDFENICRPGNGPADIFYVNHELIDRFPPSPVQNQSVSTMTPVFFKLSFLSTM